MWSTTVENKQILRYICCVFVHLYWLCEDPWLYLAIIIAPHHLCFWSVRVTLTGIWHHTLIDLEYTSYIASTARHIDETLNFTQTNSTVQEVGLPTTYPMSLTWSFHK